MAALLVDRWYLIIAVFIGFGAWALLARAMRVGRQRSGGDLMEVGH
jgi:hypothetical protein